MHGTLCTACEMSLHPKSHLDVSDPWNETLENSCYTMGWCSQQFISTRYSWCVLIDLLLWLKYAAKILYHGLKQVGKEKKKDFFFWEISV
jgi:hypothetical protein